MNFDDVLFITSVLSNALLYLAFIYLDRYTWNWKKGLCVFGLISIDYTRTDTTAYSVFIFLGIYVVATIIGVRIVDTAKKDLKHNKHLA